MKNKLLLASVLGATMLFTGCGIKTSEYSVSAKNVEKLRSYKDIKIGLEPFTAKTPGENSILCRLADTVETPKDEPFEKYIENALKDELMMAGVYDQSSEVKITAKLKDITASSMLGNAYWSFDVNVSSSNGKSIDIQSKREYGSAYLAMTACNNMGSTFGPSVKQLIEEIITHPRFNELIASK